MLSVGDWSTCNGCGKEYWIGGDLQRTIDHVEECDKARALRDCGPLDPPPRYVDRARQMALEEKLNRLVREVVYIPFWCRWGVHRWEEWRSGEYTIQHCTRCDKWRVI